MEPQSILLVEDHECLLRVLRCSLEERWPACRVDAVCSKVQAQSLLATRHYQVLITDYQLSDGNGLELASLTGKRDGKPGIVLMSAACEALPYSPEEAKYNGLNVVLRKPFTMAQFIAAIEKALLLQGATRD